MLRLKVKVDFPLRQCYYSDRKGGGSVTRRELIDLCLAYPGSYEDYPFDGIPNNGAEGDSWAVIRHRGNRKSFALIFERGGLCVNLKCEPMRADFLRSAFLEGVTPAYHMNKAHWNTVRPDLIPREDLEDMIAHSYELTRPKVRRNSREC